MMHVSYAAGAAVALSCAESPDRIVYAAEPISCTPVCLSVSGLVGSSEEHPDSKASPAIHLTQTSTLHVVLSMCPWCVRSPTDRQGDFACKVPGSWALPA